MKYIARWVFGLGVAGFTSCFIANNVSPVMLGRRLEAEYPDPVNNVLSSESVLLQLAQHNQAIKDVSRLMKPDTSGLVLRLDPDGATQTRIMYCRAAALFQKEWGWWHYFMTTPLATVVPVILRDPAKLAREAVQRMGGLFAPGGGYSTLCLKIQHPQLLQVLGGHLDGDVDKEQTAILRAVLAEFVKNNVPLVSLVLETGVEDATTKHIYKSYSDSNNTISNPGIISNPIQLTYSFQIMFQ